MTQRLDGFAFVGMASKPTDTPSPPSTSLQSPPVDYNPAVFYLINKQPYGKITVNAVHINAMQLVLCIGTWQMCSHREMEKTNRAKRAR